MCICHVLHWTACDVTALVSDLWEAFLRLVSHRMWHCTIPFSNASATPCSVRLFCPAVLLTVTWRGARPSIAKSPSFMYVPAMEKCCASLTTSLGCSSTCKWGIVHPVRPDSRALRRGPCAGYWPCPLCSWSASCGGWGFIVFLDATCVFFPMKRRVRLLKMGATVSGPAPVY